MQPTLVRDAFLLGTALLVGWTTANARRDFSVPAAPQALDVSLLRLVDTDGAGRAQLELRNGSPQLLLLGPSGDACLKPGSLDLNGRGGAVGLSTGDASSISLWRDSREQLRLYTPAQGGGRIELLHGSDAVRSYWELDSDGRVGFGLCGARGDSWTGRNLHPALEVGVDRTGEVTLELQTEARFLRDMDGNRVCFTRDGLLTWWPSWDSWKEPR